MAGATNPATASGDAPDHRITDHRRRSTMARGSTLELEDVRGTGVQSDVKISPSQRMLAACSGSLLTSLLVTPLDVVRVRLQSQHPSSTLPDVPSPKMPSVTSPIRAHRLPLAPLRFQSTPALSVPELGVTACCREVFWVNNTAEACIAAPLTTAASEACVERSTGRRFEGTWEGLVKIARYEGVNSLWRGLSPTLLMAIPANVIYFTGYDWLRGSEASPFAHLGTTWAPLIAGSSARAIAATAISPLEMFKTRLQATSSHANPNSSSDVFRNTLSGLRKMVLDEGPLTLWRGLGLTLWRDVPFSGVYWFGYEVVKEYLHQRREHQWALLHDHPTGILLPSASNPRHKEDLHAESTFLDSFVAGAASGGIAAFLTTPFDVGKTRRQIAHAKGDEIGARAASMPRVLMQIWQQEGVSGLWKGTTPRMLKVAPACAIMISSYEVGKKAAMKINRRRQHDAADDRL